MFQAISRIALRLPGFRVAALSSLARQRNSGRSLLDAAKTDRRRILVGADVERLDALVNQLPERA